MISAKYLKATGYNMIILLAVTCLLLFIFFTTCTDKPNVITVTTDGVKVYAVDANGTIIRDGIYHRDDTAVIQAAVDALEPGGILEITPGVYWIGPGQSDEGIDVSGKQDVTLIGSPGTVLQTHILNDNADFSHCLMQVTDGSHNVRISGIVFDQDRMNYTVNPVYGMQWVFRLTGGSSEIIVEDCIFRNGLQCGIVTGDVSDLLVRRCTIDTVGEHPLYLSGTDAQKNYQFIDCTILNWAKTYRGYGVKAQWLEGLTFTNCTFEQNRDGLGKLDTVYGTALINVTKATFTGCRWLGDGTQEFALSSDSSEARYVDCIFDRHGAIYGYRGSGGYTELLRCTFNFTDSDYTYIIEPNAVKESIFINPGEVTTEYNTIWEHNRECSPALENCWFVTKSMTPTPS